MKEKMKKTFKIIINILMIIIISLIIGRTIESLAETKMDLVGAASIIRENPKPLTFEDFGYCPIKKYPINKDVFNSDQCYFCAQHGIAYALSGKGPILGLHESHPVSKDKISQGSSTDKPDGDIDTSAYLYLDKNGSFIQNTGSGQYKTYYKDFKNDKETPSFTTYTNWVYINSDFTFQCNGVSSGGGFTHGQNGITNAGMGFILACFQGDGPRSVTYAQDPVQKCVWSWLGQLNRSGNPYYYLAQSFQKYHEAAYQTELNMIDITPKDNVGTEILGANYKVGPFDMGDYTRAKDYTYSTGLGTASGTITYEEYMALPENERKEYSTNEDGTYTKYDSTENSGGDNLQDLLKSKGNEYMGDILKIEAIMTNEAGTKTPVTLVEYNESTGTYTYNYGNKIPDPNATNVYFNVPPSSAYDELYSLKFTWRRIHTILKGTYYDGRQESVTWEQKGGTEKNGCQSYDCQTCEHTGIGWDSRSDAPSTHIEWCLGDGYCGTCKGICNGHKGSKDCGHHDDSCYETKEDGTRGSRTCGHTCTSWTSASSPGCYSTRYNTNYCQHGYAGGKHSSSNGWDSSKGNIYCSGTTVCKHDHTTCKEFGWEMTDHGNDYAQDAIAMRGKLAIQDWSFEIQVNVPLETDVSIYKYISKVDHVGENITLHSLGEERKNKKDKATDTVKVERGDKVTFTIDIENKSRFETRLKMEDTLPNDCDFISADSTNTLYQSGNKLKYNGGADGAKDWIVVPAKKGTTPGKVTFTVVVRPTSNTGTYNNLAEFITKNDTNPKMQYTNWGENSVHGSHSNGNIVNISKRLSDRDYYTIKEYNVSIDKYIYDVNHEPKHVATSKLDTTIGATNQRSVESGMTEANKAANPVYVEFGDTVTYKIKIYNTTNKNKSGIDRTKSPYWEPDKIYVTIEDTLPTKYSNINVSIDNGNEDRTINYIDGGKKFKVNNIEVPPNGVTTVTVTLIVEEYEKGTIQTNSVKIIEPIKNINKGTGESDNNVPDKYCVIKNNTPNKLESKDDYKLNDYDAFIDKYLYTYDEAIRKDNINLKLSNEATLVETKDGISNVLKSFQANANLAARERLADSEKQVAPVSVEKDEMISYRIKVTNEAKDVAGAISTGKKPATQVRTDKITDLMQYGLEFVKVEAKQYNSNGTICSRYNVGGNVPVTSAHMGTATEDGRTYNKYEYNITTDTILNPGEFIIYTVTVKVTESDLYLQDLDNSAELTILSNINHKASLTKPVDREIKNPSRNENISKQQKTHEYVRMKDLIIGGKVWLDFNKNGLMDDTIKDYIAQTKDESLYRKDANKLSTYYNINENAMMKDIVVKLYKEDGSLVRTTRTDGNGIFSFARAEDGATYYATQYYNLDPAKKYNSGTTYERVDKATGKDPNGNYTGGSQYIAYYIEYEYDGVVYKSTAYSGKDHLNNDGSYKGSACNHSFETNTGDYLTDDYKQEKTPGGKYKYEYDSNANEFVDERENFNTNYEYITYNQAYAVSGGTAPGSNLNFDKTDHTSQLLVDHNRKMTARSFIEQITQPGVKEATNYIPLFKYNSSNVTIPYSRYLKFINLGLELREDVDISLTKDVYKVKTSIKGEEMEYNFNRNFRINGDVLDENAVNNYKFDNPYGIELYESDYKFRNEQYSSIKAVQKYLDEQAELNVEVTYRIRVDNNKTHKDGDLKDPGSLGNGYDNKNFNDTDKTNLYVKVDEILDLYDENFIEYTPEMEAGATDYILARELDPYTGRFAEKDKEIKIAEAWYYKPSANGKYVLDDATKIYVDTTKENIAVANGAQRYDRVDLKVSNNAIKGSTNEYIDSKKYDSYDGYHKLYISGMGEEKIDEGSHLDIFVKYVLEKDSEEISMTNESWEETATEVSSELYSGASYDPKTEKVTWNWSSSSTETTTTNKVTNMIRSLVIKEHTTTPEKQAYGLATENIAQVNLYSVWYAESDKPASLVDKDSNVGNVGINNNKQVDSADNKKIYEDTIYKTGINISALGTANIPGQITETVITPDAGSGERDIRRFINGHVWDDSRNENAGDPTQFIGNGLRALGGDTAIPEAKKNELVPIIKDNPKLTEEKDIPVSSAKAEFVEVVETDANKYYELVPTDVSCDYKQHIRTDENGDYELYGYTPGKYVVRFTYGDDIEASRELGLVEQTKNGTQASQEDMYLFNGQDYKSTKYTMPDLQNGGVLNDNVVLYNDTNKTAPKEIVDANNKKIDNVIASLEAKDYNDARDDEIKRLETNSYSEIMDNMVAEILQGMANGKELSKDKYLTNNKDGNTPEELKALVGNTWMFAETIPFTVRAEKISDDLKAKVPPIINDPTYANREQLETQLTYVRDFKIENIDFGIEYRPENAVQLEKEIKEVKITTESGNTVVDLHFYTDYDKTENGSVKTHYLDTENSVGLDMIQFISNEYETNDLISKLITEKKDAFQGFVYINYDVDIQQGATIEITYEFIAENHGEVDRISKNLDDIRYQNNFASQGISSSIINNTVTGNANTNGITNYRANLTAANDMINNLYVYDAESNAFYRTSPKVLTATDGSRAPGEKVDSKGASRNKLSYYGYYSGYEYYTGEVTDFDTVAELKFNKILDYVDKDMLYLDNTKGAETLNKTWSILDNTYKEYYSSIDWARSDLDYVSSVSDNVCTPEDIENYVNNKIEGLNVKSAYDVMKNTDRLGTTEKPKLEVGGIAGASIDPDGYIYDNMLLSTDTGMYTDIYVDAGRNFAKADEVPDGTNPSVSRFLVPMVADSSKDNYSNSRGKIDLTISKAISAETNDDELEYENIAEIVEFTTLTGRRTNFDITIGNVDVRMDKKGPKDPDEYPQAVPEPDQAAAEVITLVPPQGLMKRDRVIKDVVDIAKTGTSIVGIIVAVAGVVIFVTLFAIKKYNKRRIK